ncbi:MAG TPA: hypothetical protein VF727_03080 [Allosphingosinicella sp.]|jgi:hypothetical protein
MPERRVGIVVVGGTVKIVDAEIPDDADDPIRILADDTWRLQEGGHPEAYEVIHRRCADYLKENNVARAVIKASELSGSTKLAHLESAELRGVIIAAAASATEVTLMKKSVISKTYGERKVDEYLKDDSFWDEQTEGIPLRKTSREAAMVLIASRNSK